MTNALELLRAPHLGIKDFKTHLSARIKTRHPVILMDRGKPKKVVVDYAEFIALIELVEEIQDKDLVRLVREGRDAALEGQAEIDAQAALGKLRSRRAH